MNTQDETVKILYSTSSNLFGVCQHSKMKSSTYSDNGWLYKAILSVLLPWHQKVETWRIATTGDLYP